MCSIVVPIPNFLQVFELRVNKNMCHFVTIIVRIIGEIRVFFFVLAGGILAFTIAILHLLRGCPVGECNKDVKFPYPFHLAFSSTYFFMVSVVFCARTVVNKLTQVSLTRLLVLCRVVFGILLATTLRKTMSLSI